jgi:hypothetical protein
LPSTRLARNASGKTDSMQDDGQDASGARNPGDGSAEPERAEQVKRASAESSGGAAAEPTAPAPKRTIRYSRRRFLKLLGALAAVAGGVGLLRWIGGGPGKSGTGTGGSGDSAAGSGGVPGTDEFPQLNVERAPPEVPASEWVVVVDGLVDHPQRIDRATWETLARVRETETFHCVEGWSVDGLRWGGVAPRTLLEQAGVRPGGRFVSFYAAGGTYADSLSLEQVMDGGTLLADTLDEAPLAPGHGGPLRLVIPAQLGYKNVKWVVRLEVTDEQATGYWEQRGYPVDAPVTGGF